MKNILHITVLFLNLFGTEVLSATSWSYDTQDQWPLLFPSCGSKRQSPVAINTSQAVPIELAPLNFINYESLQDVSISNNCRMVEIKLLSNATAKPQISGGPLQSGDIYEFLNCHLHWTAEHVIDGRRYSLELHIVHYNLKYSPEEAALHHDGLAVIAILYQTKETVFSGLLAINTVLPLVRQCDTSANISNFSLATLVNGVKSLEQQKYYSYQGSLTVPQCSEAVNWFVYANAIGIHASQYKSFQTLLDDQQRDITENYRQLQSIEDRTISTPAIF